MSSWRFLLDENIDPKVAMYLKKEGISAEHVRETLGQGADDREDVLLYAQANDFVVTSDLNDFGSLPDGSPGVVLLYDDTMPAYRVAAGLISMVEAYPSRSEFTGRERLDPWV